MQNENPLRKKHDLILWELCKVADAYQNEHDSCIEMLYIIVIAIICAMRPEMCIKVNGVNFYYLLTLSIKQKT